MKTMASSISQRCELLFGCSRKDLGIVASARAIMNVIFRDLGKYKTILQILSNYFMSGDILDG